LCITFPDKGFSQGVIRTFPLGFQALHLLALPANHRPMVTMVQKAEMNPDGGGLTLHLTAMHEGAGDFTEQTTGAFVLIHFNPHVGTPPGKTRLSSNG
jgi:hypothetical protein